MYLYIGASPLSLLRSQKPKLTDMFGDEQASPTPPAVFSRFSSPRSRPILMARSPFHEPSAFRSES